MDTVGGFLARLCAAITGSLMLGPAVARTSLLDDVEPALLDSHAEALAAFDRELGAAPCTDCGTIDGLLPKLSLCRRCAEIRARAEARWQEPDCITLDSGSYLSGPSMTVSEILAHQIGAPIPAGNRIAMYRQYKQLRLLYGVHES